MRMKTPTRQARATPFEARPPGSLKRQVGDAGADPLSECPVGQQDHDPRNDRGAEGHSHENREGRLRQEVDDGDGDGRHHRRKQNPRVGDPAAGQTHESLRGVALAGKRIEDAAVGVEPRIVDGEGGSQDDEVEYVGRNGNATESKIWTKGLSLPLICLHGTTAMTIVKAPM